MAKLKLFHGGIGRANIRIPGNPFNDGQWAIAAYSQKEVLAAIGTGSNPFNSGHVTTLKRWEEDPQWAQMLENPGVIFVREGCNYPRPPWKIWVKP